MEVSEIKGIVGRTICFAITDSCVHFFGFGELGSRSYDVPRYHRAFQIQIILIQLI